LSAAETAPRLYLLAEERKGAFDGYRADRALVEIQRGLERAGGGVAVHVYHAADCDPVGLADAIETPSLFGARTLIVIRGAEALGEGAQEHLANALERQAPQVTVAVVARAADMRRRFFARCRDLGRRLPVDHPRPGEMPAIADRMASDRGRRLDPDARDLLLDGVGRDLLLLASELDKLAAAVPEGRNVSAADVGRVSAAGREHGNFEFTDAVCARDAATATRRLGQALDEGAHPIAVIGALAAVLKPVLAGAEMVARGRRVDEAAGAIGLNPYQRTAFDRAVRAYAPGEIRRALLRLAEIDVAGKSGGDGRALLEEWVLSLCVKRGASRRASGAAGR
jgi:DNA polymerase-3 subunit delta